MGQNFILFEVHGISTLNAQNNSTNNDLYLNFKKAELTKPTKSLKNRKFSNIFG